MKMSGRENIPSRRVTLQVLALSLEEPRAYLLAGIMIAAGIMDGFR